MGLDDVTARGPEMAVDFVGAKLANAGGKMAKLVDTDLFLDGQGTSSATTAIDGLNAAIDNGNVFTSYGGTLRTDVGTANGVSSAGINGYVASLASGFTLKAVAKAYGSSWFGAEHVDMMVSDQNSFDHLFKYGPAPVAA